MGFMEDLAGDWVVYGEDNLRKEIDYVKRRSLTGDHYPQGRDTVIARIEQAIRERRSVHIVAARTFPKWTWYVDIQ